MTPSTRPLNRTTYDAAPAAPVRLIHLGLGAFHRAHQVFYTVQAEADPSAPEWGYCSFTGRGPSMAEKLSSQDGLFTLVTRSGDGDEYDLVEGIVEAQPADNVARLRELMASEDLAVVTMTVTEAGYHLTQGLEINTSSSSVATDIDALRGDHSRITYLGTAAGKLVLGLSARREAGLGGIAIMSCDNIASNGNTVRASVLGLAREVDEELAEWIEENVTFPSSSIDRITPASASELARDVAEATGYEDVAPVVAEPFASWVIEGDFPNGRPAWERAGAQFVEDIEQFENRKLWLLNGSHSLMAYYGQLRGHDTVAEAIADADVRSRVETLWDEAARHLTADGLDIPGYRAALIERFENPRIRHNLAQIGIDGATKQRMRVVAIMNAELGAGRDGSGAAFSIAAWIAFVLGNENAANINDTRASEIDKARRAGQPIRALVAVLDEDLAANESALATITGHVEALTS